MNSQLTGYNLPIFTSLLRHRQTNVVLLRDRDGIQYDADHREVDAQVRSGDYFVTLATILDMLASEVDDYSIRTKLEGIVSDLMYLQDGYTVTKNEQVESV